MRFRLFIFCILAVNVLSGHYRDYLKPVENKSDLHAIRNIDFIYMINLDARPEKFESSISQLHPHGIYPYRFSAVNGWELSLEALNDCGVVYESSMEKNLKGSYFPKDGDGTARDEYLSTPGKNYYCHGMVPGTIGICLSHLSILHDAYESGYDTIWIMEDDVEVIEDPNTISDYIEQLDEVVGRDNWDILFTDPDTKGKDGKYVVCSAFARRPNYYPDRPNRFKERVIINDIFRKVGARYGSYSMVVRRSGMKKLIDFFDTYSLFLPYDMEYIMPDDIALYTLNFDVVSTQPAALSDNGTPGYKTKDAK